MRKELQVGRVSRHLDSSPTPVLQEVLTKLIDTCVLIAGRAFEQGNWIRRGTKDLIAPERGSPISRGMLN